MKIDRVFYKSIFIYYHWDSHDLWKHHSPYIVIYAKTVQEQWSQICWGNNDPEAGQRVQEPLNVQQATKHEFKQKA